MNVASEMCVATLAKRPERQAGQVRDLSLRIYDTLGPSSEIVQRLVTARYVAMNMPPSTDSTTPVM